MFRRNRRKKPPSLHSCSAALPSLRTGEGQRQKISRPLPRVARGTEQRQEQEIRRESPCPCAGGQGHSILLPAPRAENFSSCSAGTGGKTAFPPLLLRVSSESSNGREILLYWQNKTNWHLICFTPPREQSFRRSPDFGATQAPERDEVRIR
jgi:hypothetical protein